LIKNVFKFNSIVIIIIEHDAESKVTKNFSFDFTFKNMSGHLT